VTRDTTRTLRTARGTLRIAAATPEWIEPAIELALDAASRPFCIGEFVTFLGRRAYFKKRRIHGRARVELAWRTLAPFARMPREREYARLTWLAERSFQVPQPLAAGVLARHGLPRFQFLLCAEIAPAVTLDEFLRHGWTRAVGVNPWAAAPAVPTERSSPSTRAIVATEIARELARMHALHFVHGAATPDHVLVGRETEAWRVHFLAPRPAHAIVRTLTAALDVAPVASALDAAERGGFVATYVEERAAQGRPVDARRLEHALRLHCGS
jgi:hypothetical protein